MNTKIRIISTDKVPVNLMTVHEIELFETLSIDLYMNLLRIA